VERARVARELHDGAIQALFGIEMRIDALRRRATTSPQDVAKELEEVQELLRSEVLELRELMQALRPIELETSDQLPDVLASLVERFRRDTGVSARFVFDGGPVTLPAPTALELARIVQEALVNVRKHSRARNVLVRLTNTDEKYTLVVEDDGQGFEFEGRLSDRELEKRRVGPRYHQGTGAHRRCAARCRFRAGYRRTSRADARSRGSCLTGRATCGSP
jgi:two-component system sensor histidine kinase DegS